MSSVVTWQKWNLRIQIGQVLQIYVHYISAKYHSLRLHTFKGETFWSLPLVGHVTCTLRNALFKMFLESSIAACINFSNMPLKEGNSKNICAYHAPTESVGRSAWKNTQRDKVPSQYFRNCTLFSTQGLTINYLNVFEWEKSLATATSASHALNTSSGSYHICVAILRVGRLTKTDRWL